MENISTLETNVVCLERCESFLQIPTEEKYLNIRAHVDFLTHNIDYPIRFFVPKKTNSRSDERYTYQQINTPNFKKTFLHSGLIEYTNVFARYPISKDYALKNINLKITKGEKIGICG